MVRSHIVMYASYNLVICCENQEEVDRSMCNEWTVTKT